MCGKGSKKMERGRDLEDQVYIHVKFYNVNHLCIDCNK